MKKCKLCTALEKCDDCFIAKADEQFNLNVTINAIRESLSPDNRAAFDQWDYRSKQWLAIQAWTDGMVKSGDRIVASDHPKGAPK